MKFAIAITILQLAAGACAGPLRGSDASVNVARFGQRDVDTTAPVLSARKKGKAAGAVAGAAAGTAAVAATGAVTKGTSTLVLKESGGVAGNECLTFRNNGEIVDAACVNTAADRQMTPSTLNGQNVLLVQRTFTGDFRSDLVGKQVCVGFNGTTFLAEDCASKTDFVNFQNKQLVSTSGACQSGHDSAAQLTVDTTGKNCATLSSTTVTATTT